MTPYFACRIVRTNTRHKKPPLFCVSVCANGGAKCAVHRESVLWISLNIGAYFIVLFVSLFFFFLQVSLCVVLKPYTFFFLISEMLLPTITMLIHIQRTKTMLATRVFKRNFKIDWSHYIPQTSDCNVKTDPVFTMCCLFAETYKNLQKDNVSHESLSSLYLQLKLGQRTKYMEVEQKVNEVLEYLQKKGMLKFRLFF